MKLACFLKVNLKLTASWRLSKSRYSTKFQARFARREKSLVKKVCNYKERSFDFLSFEGVCIDFGGSEPKLRRFKIRRFCDKMRPFCTIVYCNYYLLNPIPNLYHYPNANPEKINY